MKSIDKKISIIVVTYNSSTNIEKLIKSIDTKSNSELVELLAIIENDSPEKMITTKIIKKYKTRYLKKIKYIQSASNSGFAKSCNFGASLSNTEYILFLNPDTELTKNSLTTLLCHAIKANSDLTGGKCLKYNGSAHNTVVRFPTLGTGLFEFSNLGKIFNIKFGNANFYYRDKDFFGADHDVCVEALGGAYLLVKRSSFIRLRGFDEDYFMYLEDVDLSVRANRLGMKSVFCPHSTIFHIGGSSTKNKYHIRHQSWYDSRRLYFHKHFGVLTNLIIQPIYIFEEYVLKIRQKFL